MLCTLFGHVFDEDPKNPILLEHSDDVVALKLSIEMQSCRRCGEYRFVPTFSMNLTPIMKAATTKQTTTRKGNN